jgi:intraflagellar transport protein 172
MLHIASPESMSNLRDMLMILVKHPDVPTKFTQYLTIAHLSTLRNKSSKNTQLAYFSAKQSIALLRYTADIPVDKTFYLAGLNAKSAGMTNMAFVCWNRFLDICEAIEENDPSLLDSTDFENTDIPLTVPLPSTTLPEKTRESVRDWVLEVSLDTTLHQDIDKRLCAKCSTDIYDAALSCHNCGDVSEACIVTGYPVVGGTKCGACGCGANKEDWNKWVMVEKSCPWCGVGQTPSFRG